jgi:hypothetical protein
VGLTLMAAPSHLLRALCGWEVEASCPAVLQHCHAVLLLYCCCAAWCERAAHNDAALCTVQSLAAPVRAWNYLHGIRQVTITLS